MTMRSHITRSKIDIVAPCAKQHVILEWKPNENVCLFTQVGTLTLLHDWQKPIVLEIFTYIYCKYLPKTANLNIL